jgi:hypothetical protein
MTAGLVAALGLAAGCLPHHRDLIGTGGRPPVQTPIKADAAQLVGYLNANADRIDGIQALNVSMECRQGKQSGGLDGSLAASRPRNFRLKAKVAGQSVADIGSNDGEFWYWISKAPQPYVYHCSYADFTQGNVQLDFPFQPDMVLAALGLLKYDPSKPYRLKETGQYLELIEETTSPQGQPVDKVTVFNRNEVNKPGQPQVVGHLLKDKQGKVLCQAVIKEVSVNRQTGAVLPRVLVLSWPDQQMQMDLTLRDAQVTSFDPQKAERLFKRGDLVGQTSYDLARRMIDGPGLQRTGLK